MKALCVQSPNHMVIEERPMPEISLPGEVLVKVKAGGICGSDMHVYHGSSPVATYPRVIGHEVVGEIVEKGTGVTAFNAGDRVAMDPVISCGECYQCRIGRNNVCRNLKVRSAHVDGGFQEYVVLPQHSIYLLPYQLSWEEGAMIEPFTIAEQVCSRAQLNKEDVVFIMGAGPIGLSALIRAKLSGATVYISDIVTSRLALAKSHGADAVIDAKNENVKSRLDDLTGGNGPAVIIDAVCSVQSFEQAVEWVCPAGRVITLGFSKQPSAIAQFHITAKELDVRGSRLHNNKFPTVIDHFASGRIRVKDLVTHRFPFTDVHKALEVMEDNSIEKGKVMLLF